MWALVARVMVTVLRNVTVAMVKEELLKVLQLNNILSTGSVILAEVLSHYINRVLVSISSSPGILCVGKYWNGQFWLIESHLSSQLLRFRISSHN